jgi:glucan phosphoethanolaminetransferase (alkaline phosphatase superfamily)
VFDKIFGLPMHILVVHAVVVLVPLCAVGAVLMLVSATWRERLRWVEVVLLTVAAVSAFVAKQSGESLKAHLGTFTNASLERHVTLGTKAPWIVLAFWALTVAWLVLDARRADDPDASVSEATVRVLGVLAVVAAVGATTWVVLTGDAGSRSIWGNVASGPPALTTADVG